VDDQPIAEWLPERYRNVLDRIADLEASGRHLAADGVRQDAIRVYSRTWTRGTARRLDDLAIRAERLLVASPARRRRPRAAFIALAASRIRATRRARVDGALTPERPTA
jgi:hypothetical protein